MATISVANIRHILLAYNPFTQKTILAQTHSKFYFPTCGILLVVGYSPFYHRKKWYTMIHILQQYAILRTQSAAIGVTSVTLAFIIPRSLRKKEPWNV